MRRSVSIHTSRTESHSTLNSLIWFVCLALLVCKLWPVPKAVPPYSVVSGDENLTNQDSRLDAVAAVSLINSQHPSTANWVDPIDQQSPQKKYHTHLEPDESTPEILTVSPPWNPQRHTASVAVSKIEIETSQPLPTWPRGEQRHIDSPMYQGGHATRNFDTVSLPSSIAKLSPEIVNPVAATQLDYFFRHASQSLKIYLDDTCARFYDWDDSSWNRKARSRAEFLRPRHNGDWMKAWNDSDASTYAGQSAVHWPQKFGAAGFLPHMVKESPWATTDFRRANFSLVVLMARQAGPVTSVPAQCRKLLAERSEAWRATDGKRHFFVLTDSRGPCCNNGIFKDVEFLANHVIGHHGERASAPIFKHAPGPPLHCFQLDKDITIPTPTLHSPALRAASSSYMKALRKFGQTVEVQESKKGKKSRRDILLVAAGMYHGRDEFVDMHSEDPDMVVRKRIRQADYYKYMTRSKFCAILPGFAYQTPRIAEALHMSCVPVFLTPNYSPPFDGTLDWSKFSLEVSPEKWGNLKQILLAANYDKLFKNMRTVRGLYEYKLDGYTGDGVLPMIVYEMWSRVLQRSSAVLKGASATNKDFAVDISLESGADAGKHVERDAKGIIQVSGAGMTEDERWLCKTKKGVRDGALCSCGQPRRPRKRVPSPTKK